MAREDLSAQEEIIDCPTCGQAVPTGCRFCGNCGTELSGEADHHPAPNGGTVLDSEPLPYLLITTGPGRGQTFELRGEVQVGRSRTNSVVLTDGKVSRDHARLDPVRDTFILTDLGSANGTFVNGVRITQPVRLRDGDLLQIGDTQLVFHTQLSPHPLQANHAADYHPPSPIPAIAPSPAPSGAPQRAYQGGKLPTWAWVACAVVIIVIGLLMIVALTTGILIGQGLGGV